MHVLIIGAGSVTRSMIKSALKFSWFRELSIVDPNSKSTEQLRAHFPNLIFQEFTSIDEASSSSSYDSVWINTPSHLHYEHIFHSLSTTSQILVAKPLTDSYKKSCEIASLAKLRNVVLSVAHQMRYHEHIQYIIQLIREGLVGKIESIIFHNSKNRPEVGNLGSFHHPVLYEMTCHHFDIISSFLKGFKVSSVYCCGTNPSWSNYRSNSVINAVIQFENNIICNYHAAYSSQSPYYSIRIEGNKGTLKFDGLHMSVNQGTLSFAPVGEDFKVIQNFDNNSNSDVWYEFLKDWHTNIDSPSIFHAEAQENLEILKAIDLCILSNENLITVTN